jgi:hypothetical protein
MRKILEIKAFLGHLLPRGETLSFLVQFLKDIVVACQNRVDVAHDVGLLVCFFVIIAVAARIAAEFLVHATINRLTAIEAFSFLFVHILLSLLIVELFNFVTLLLCEHIP